MIDYFLMDISRKLICNQVSVMFECLDKNNNFPVNQI